MYDCIRAVNLDTNRKVCFCLFILDYLQLLRPLGRISDACKKSLAGKKIPREKERERDRFVGDKRKFSRVRVHIRIARHAR